MNPQQSVMIHLAGPRFEGYDDHEYQPSSKGWCAVRDLLPGPILSSEFDIVPAKAALLVVDVQRVAADRAIGLGSYLAEHDPDVHKYVYGRIEDLVVPNIRRLLASIRRAGRPVIYVVNGSSTDDYSDYLPLRRGRINDVGFIPRVGSPEYEILKEVQPEPNDVVVMKRSTSPFNSTGLDQILRNMGVTVVIAVGVATDACVGLTVRDAADRGYGVVVVEDGTATYTPERHDAFLSFFGSVHGKVMTTDQILPYFSGV